MININNEEITNEFLQTVILDDELFKILFFKIDIVGFINIALNVTLSENMIEQIFQKNIPNANINLLKHKNCPKLKLDFFIKENDKVYNIAMSHNEYLDEHQFNKLFHHRDFDVNISLAHNIKTPKMILKQLATLNNKYINEALCSNTNTPINILMQFQYDNEFKKILENNKTFKTR